MKYASYNSHIKYLWKIINIQVNYINIYKIENILKLKTYKLQIVQELYLKRRLSLFGTYRHEIYKL